MLLLISVNIEGDRHLGRVARFLTERAPDLVCLQEVFEKDLPLFAQVVGPYSSFAPMELKRLEGGLVAEGIAMVSRFPLEGVMVRQYGGDPVEAVVFDNVTTTTKQATQRYLLLTATVSKDGISYRIGTTHFTWTPDGEADEYQRADVVALLAALKAEGDLVVAGDFNAPRGKEIFAKLAERYMDNIPAHYTTSIDGTLHRKGPLPYMVDGLFSSPRYRASEVALVSGVSDHCAITALIGRV